MTYHKHSTLKAQLLILHPVPTLFIGRIEDILDPISHYI